MLVYLRANDQKRGRAALLEPMEKIAVNFENCYGIRKLEAEFNFDKKAANVIYAPNGMMKTSFAKTFQDFSRGEESQDRIYRDRKVVREIHFGGDRGLNGDNVFVIEPYVSSYESQRISTLLANRELKEEYDANHQKIDDQKREFLTLLARIAGLKSGLEDEFSKAFTQRSDNFLAAMDRIKREVEEEEDASLAEIAYQSIFNSKVEKLLEDDAVREGLKEYTERYDELLSASRFFRKGVFNHYQAGEIAKQLKSHGFFQAEHSIYLNSEKGEVRVESEAELKEIIATEMQGILQDSELKKAFESLDKKLQANQDLRAFREFLLANQQIIPRLSNYELLRQDLLKAYCIKHKEQFLDLLETYDSVKKRLQELAAKASEEATKWQEVINIFNRRFSVPFKVSIENKQDVILKQVTPNVSFEFNDGVDITQAVDREKLLEVLSNGEKRALYILNIIFEVEARREAGIPTLFVVDDIADSFDYKNKYAIVEYLRDILEEPNFRQIILTHNYDFYRTVWRRLDLNGAIYQVTRTEDGISLLDESMYRDPFEKWKDRAGQGNRMDMFLAMIPFTRNLAEYCGYSEKAERLTALLHIKQDTDGISLGDLIEIFSGLLNGASFDAIEGVERSVKEVLFEEADKIAEDANLGNELEKKIVLSIAVRLRAEEFMIAKIADPDMRFNSHQTAKMVSRFKAVFGEDASMAEHIRCMERVGLMTPENIHLNSFMYEPILDMSSQHLVSLLQDVKALS